MGDKIVDLGCLTTDIALKQNSQPALNDCLESKFLSPEIVTMIKNASKIKLHIKGHKITKLNEILIYDWKNLPKRGWYKIRFSIERRLDILPKFADIIGLGPRAACSRSD